MMLDSIDQDESRLEHHDGAATDSSGAKASRSKAGGQLSVLVLDIISYLALLPLLSKRRWLHPGQHCWRASTNPCDGLQLFAIPSTQPCSIVSFLDSAVKRLGPLVVARLRGVSASRLRTNLDR